ncbi:MAG TPA: hypothetical protein VFN35_25425 [Ktedonobacteraceae bacterium]|nr:hypothetical protein [Ktedonobacteraceae bacterium]
MHQQSRCVKMLLFLLLISTCKERIFHDPEVTLVAIGLHARIIPASLHGQGESDAFVPITSSSLVYQVAQLQHATCGDDSDGWWTGGALLTFHVWMYPPTNIKNGYRFY